MEWCDKCKRQVPNASECVCSFPQSSKSNRQLNENQVPETGVEQLSAMVVDTRPRRQVQFFGKTFAALLDSGSTATYIHPKVASWIISQGVDTVQIPVKTSFADCSSSISTNHAVFTQIHVGNKFAKNRFIIFPNLQEEVILGKDILDKLRFKMIDLDEFLNTNGTEICNALVHRELLLDEEKLQLENLLESRFKEFDKLKGITTYTEHVIRMKSDEPVRHKYFSKNPKMREIIYKQIDELIKSNRIEPSSSSYCSPIVLVKKKDDSWRMCIDYRKINENSIRDAYPMPQIPSILNRLKEARYVSAIDLKNGYWQVPIRADSRQYTAFTVPGRGLYQWRVMPFGLHSAPATFQRLLDRIVTHEIHDFAIAYLDDIIIYSKSFSDHLNHIDVVLSRLITAGLSINKEKSIFCKSELKYLGHIVGNGGIQTDPEKVRAIKELEPPVNVKGVRRILGMVSWYSKFIENFTKIVSPLQALLKKDCKFHWGEEQEKAFTEIKEKMASAPVIACPDYSLPFFLQTDASDVGLGAVLFQRKGDQEQVLSYYSRTLRPSEKNYTTTEKECLAVLWGIEKNREYLEGLPFTVITDHLALRWIFKLPNPTARLGRWVMELRNHDFVVEYRKGALNVVPDTLSRHPLGSNATDESCNALSSSSDECSWLSSKMFAVVKEPDKYPEYTIINNQLFRNCGSSVLGENPWKLCVPKNLRMTVLQENHSDVTAGHLGTRKTIHRVQSRYYWPGIFRDVKKYIGNCKECLEHKIPQVKPAGKMYSTQTAGPWEVVTADFVGPFPRSSKGHKNLLVSQDKFTKWVVCTAIGDATASVLKRVIREKIFCQFGWFKVLISDNGSQFISKLFKKFLDENGIRHQLTPAYSPQCNSTERVNRVLKTMIKQYIRNDHRKWDEYIPEIQFAVNTALQDSTGFSAAQLNFVRELRKPSLVSDDQEIGIANHFTDQIDFQNKMKELFELVKTNMLKASIQQAKYYNMRRRQWLPELGEKVYKRLHHISSAQNNFAAKLAPSFAGPYVVYNYESPTVLVLKDLENTLSDKTYKVHIKDIKRIDQN